jgi:hypothetical protein
VLKCTKLKKFQFDQKKSRNEESKFHRIEKLCSGQNDGYLLDSAVLFLNYAAFLNFFHKKISRVGEDALTLSQLKNLFKSTLLRMQTTLDSDEPYAALIDSARLMSESAISSSTVDEIDSRWCRATAVARRKRLNAVARAVVEKTKWKIQKDYDLMKDIQLPEDRRIACSNRAVGKLFSCSFKIHSLLLRIILFDAQVLPG